MPFATAAHDIDVEVGACIPLKVDVDTRRLQVELLAHSLQKFHVACLFSFGLWPARLVHVVLARAEIFNQQLLLATVDSLDLVGTLESHWAMVGRFMMGAALFTRLARHAASSAEEALLKASKTLLLSVFEVNSGVLLRP